MPGLNHVIIRGNITRELDLSYTPTETPSAVLKFTIGFSEKYTDKAGKEIEKSNFVPVTIWKKQAEAAAANLVKGQEVIVEGRLAYDHWEDENHNGHSRLYVVASYLYYGRKPKSAAGTQPDNVPEDEEQ
jgi:single-strand DNA-binding protein